jgi:precorrin-6Y C5,15-methyltransferase (decarboxylating)
MSAPWLSVIGIGEDGIYALAPTARALVEAAEILIGGERHLAMVPGSAARRISWQSDFTGIATSIGEHRGRRVVVLASGDPMDFGVGAVLAGAFGPDDMTIIPATGSITLACARMGWSRQDVEVVTIHGRPLTVVNRVLTPGAKLLLLSADAGSPRAVADLLVESGYGNSLVAVLERLGGPNERRLDGSARSWPHSPGADLNVIAVDLKASPTAPAWSRASGLPDDAFRHDGQITKREVRAATLAALAPLPGNLLWDLGAGSGSIAIEWLRAEPRARAVAVERRADRILNITGNAAQFGVPQLEVVEGAVPDILGQLSGPPSAIFLGGGVGRAGLLEACFEALAPGGRLVANGVTLEAEAALLGAYEGLGGGLIRLSVERAGAIGPMTRLKPLMPVLQWRGVKP